MGLERNFCVNLKFDASDHQFPETITRYCSYDKANLVCEKHERTDKRCLVPANTIINYRNQSFREEFNENVDVVLFYAIKNVQFLPILLHRKFPNLGSIIAANCSIVEISKQNFQNLRYLTNVILSSNKINAIWSDTFNNLPSLEQIWLGKSWKVHYSNVNVCF